MRKMFSLPVVLSRFLLVVFSAIFCLILAGQMTAQSTEFTYQGSMKDGVNLANGDYDFEFALFDALTAGAQVGSTLTRSPVAVSGGIFSVSLDFGGVFPGASRFLELRVRPTGGGLFNTLSPRQQIDSTPYSVKSLTTDNATTATTAASATNSTQLNGQPDTFYRSASNMNAGTLSNSRTTGTTANTANTLVLRNASGGFSAGPITTGMITLATTTRAYAIPPTAFVPEADGYDYTHNLNGIWGYTTGQVLEFAAPVNLPDGATITEVRFYILDNDAAQNINCGFATRVHTALTASGSGSASSTGASGTVQQITVGGPPLVVDNDTASYQVWANWLVPNAPYENLRLGPVKITYTVTSPLP